MARGDLELGVAVTGLAGALRGLADIGRVLNSNATAAQKFGGVISTSIGIAVTAITGFVAASKSLTDNIEDIGVQARNLGVTTDQFQNLTRAARLADVPMEKLTTAYKRFQVTLGNIGANKEGLNLIEELSPAIARAAAAGQDGFTTFIQMSEALDEMEDKSRAAYIAQKNFSRSAAEVHDIAAAYKAAAEEAGRFGLNFSAEEIAKAGHYADQFEHVSEIIGVMLKRSFLELIPVIDTFIERFDTMMQNISTVPSLENIQNLNDQIASTRMEIVTLNQLAKQHPIGELVSGIFNQSYADDIKKAEQKIVELTDRRDAMIRGLKEQPPSPDKPTFTSTPRGVPKPAGGADKHDYWEDIRQKAIEADRAQATAMDNQRARIQANLAADIKAQQEELSMFKGNADQKAAYATETERTIAGLKQQAAVEIGAIDKKELDDRKKSLDQWSDYVSNILEKTETDELQSIRRKAANELEQLRQKYELELQLHQLTADEKTRIDQQYALASKAVLENMVVDLKKAELNRLRDSTSIVDRLKYEWSQSTNTMTDQMVGFIDTTVNGLTEMATSGKADFAEFARSVILDMAKMITKMLVIQAIQAALGWITGGSTGGSFTNEAGFIVDTGPRVAKGAAFQGGNVIPFRRGGVVDKPTIFPMATGMGLMGESGPEAVLPLTRGSDGDLGVRASSGGGGLTVGSINVTVQSTTKDPKQQGDIIGSAIERHLKEMIHKEVGESFRPGNSMNRGRTIGGGTIL